MTAPESLSVPAAVAPGRLPAPARRALVELMRQGVVMAESRRLVFDALCQHRALIADHLADMYLRVLIDEPAGMALLLGAPAQTDADAVDDDSPSLIGRRMLTLYDTLLLIVLRKHFLDRETAGDLRIRVELQQIESLMVPFLPLTASTSGDRKRLNGAVEAMKKRKILNAVRGEDDRVEIAPAIRYIVPAEYLERLLGEYRRMAQAQAAGGDLRGAPVDAAPDDDDDDDG